MEIVKDKRLLNRMAKAGHIVLHEHTGKMVGSYYGKVKAWYVKDCQFLFEFEGKWYESHYISGCFYPYVGIS